MADATFQCVDTHVNHELLFFVDTTATASPCEGRNRFAIGEFQGAGHYCEVLETGMRMGNAFWWMYI